VSGTTISGIFFGRKVWKVCTEVEIDGGKIQSRSDLFVANHEMIGGERLGKSGVKMVIDSRSQG